MGTKQFRRLEDYESAECDVEIICVDCGNRALFSVRDIINYFRAERWNTDLGAAAGHFRCVGGMGKPPGCGSKRVRLKPKLRDKPVTVEVPKGMSEREWKEEIRRRR